MLCAAIRGIAVLVTSGTAGRDTAGQLIVDAAATFARGSAARQHPPGGALPLIAWTLLVMPPRLPNSAMDGRQER